MLSYITKKITYLILLAVVISFYDPYGGYVCTVKSNGTVECHKVEVV